jgi:hypothetical protein
MKIQRGWSHTCFWRPKMFAALMMILAYCFPLSSFCDHLSVLSFLLSQQLLKLRRWCRSAVSVLWMNTGLSFVCRDEDNFKDNSRHCVCCPLVLSFSLYIFFALVFTLFFALVSGLIFRVPAYVFSPFFFSVFPFFFPLRSVFIVSESFRVWETKFQSNSFFSLKFEFN